MVGYGEEIYCGIVTENSDIFLFLQFGDKTFFDGFSRRIHTIENSSTGMATLSREDKLVFRGTGKRHADFLDKKILNQFRPFVRDDFNGFKIGNTISCLHDIFDKKIRRIVDASGYYPSLGVESIRLLDGFLFCHHNNVKPFFRDCNGR